MNIQLIQGHFETKEAIDLIAKMIHIKIKFQEDKINNNSNEEDVKMHENRIKQLQKDLFNARESIGKQKGKIAIQSEINIS